MKDTYSYIWTVLREGGRIQNVSKDINKLYDRNDNFVCCLNNEDLYNIKAKIKDIRNGEKMYEF